VFEKFILYPVTIVHGLSVGCIPSVCGKQFNQITALHYILFLQSADGTVAQIC